MLFHFVVFNFLGFAVLHILWCAGHVVVIIQVDKSTYNTFQRYSSFIMKCLWNIYGDYSGIIFPSSQYAVST